MQVPPEAIALMTREVALRYCVCPIAISDPRDSVRSLTLASIDPTNLFLIDEVQRIVGRKVMLVPATEQDIMLGIAIYYLEAAKKAAQQPAEVSEEVSSIAIGEEPITVAEQHLGSIKMVDGILQRAVNERTTDIHIEPHEEATFVRFRIDGVMYDHQTFDPALHSTIISRIKILAGLDIAQNRLPQDGRFELTVGTKNKRLYDIRTSIIPLLTGQKAVLRLLPKGHMSVSFNQLGLSSKNRETLMGLINKPYGMMLATGPTGSGKTSTMYACLSMVDCIGKNVITVEDPVEFQFQRVGQMQVHPKIGLDFAAGLRAILRQDPDIIMVGEIRDLETLSMAVQSSLTGHLVFSTLHCNDAAAGAARMINMGAEPFLVTSAVSGILSQRLVRKLCEKCKVQASVSRQIRRQLNLPTDDDTIYYHGMGCQHCRNTGYYGRVSVFEVLPMFEEIQQAIIRKATSTEIRHIMLANNVASLRDDALDKARAGLTSLEEVIRSVYVDDV